MTDQSLPEDEDIELAHPLRTGRHDLYAEAMRLVGAKNSKAALVELVNWLLCRIATKVDAVEAELSENVDSEIAERTRCELLEARLADASAEIARLTQQLALNDEGLDRLGKE